MNLEEFLAGEAPNKENKGPSKIELEIEKRMKARLPNKFIKKVLAPLGIKKFVIAGNSCNEEPPNDLDLYFTDETVLNNLYRYMGEKFSDVNLYITKNAISFVFDGTRIQCCKYSKQTLQQLVESFDFAHIQIGVLVGIYDNGVNIVNPADVLLEIYYTPAWLEARVLRKTWYTGSEYPLSSLIRAHKYAKRGWLSNSDYRKTICEILTSLISRGFYGYNDFKDQMLAIDLMELSGDESDVAWKLYETCVAKGLVGDTSSDEEEK